MTSAEQYEYTLKICNDRITRKNKLMRRIPTNYLKNWYFEKYLVEFIEARNEVFRRLRVQMRKEHPENFIGYEYTDKS